MPELSAIIPALNEGLNLQVLLPELCSALAHLQIECEILIVTRGFDELTCRVAAENGAVVLEQVKPGYGGALAHGFSAARGNYVLTLDADYSHKPEFVRALWGARARAEIVIASRYVRGGSAVMPLGRYLLSRALNTFYRIGLRLPVHDLSSGFRLYRAGVVRAEEIQARNFDVLPELLARACARGCRVEEVPFAYAPREHGSSHASVIRFGMGYWRTFQRLRHFKKENAILAVAKRAKPSIPD